MQTWRERAAALDAADPLAWLRERFVVLDPEQVYLDGNSLGRLPVATRERLRAFVEQEWARELVGGWERWIGLPLTVGDALGSALLGVSPGETLVCDTVTTNLAKVVLALLRRDPGRRDVLTDDDNFPTDRSVVAEAARLVGGRVRVVHSDIDTGVDVDVLEDGLDERVGVVSLSHTAYRSGALAPVPEIDAVAHRVGAATVWDLSHTVGAVPVDLSTADAAVGCTYKHVNAGPGAPAFLWVRPGLVDNLRNPVPGWFGAATPFAMDAPYEPAPGVRRFLTGTPPVSGLLAVEEGVRLLADAGLPALRARSVALTSLAVDLIDDLPAAYGVRLASPRDPRQRGGHVTLEHPQAWQLVQELRARGVVTDHREPSRLRLGPSPAYTRFAEVVRAIEQLADVLATRAHLRHPAEATGVT